MRSVALLLALVACSDLPQELPSAKTLWCPWIWRGETVLAPAQDGACWLVTPPGGMAVTEPQANACAASRGAGPTVWPGGQRLAMWVRLGSSGELHVDPVAVACP